MEYPTFDYDSDYAHGTPFGQCKDCGEWLVDDQVHCVGDLTFCEGCAVETELQESATVCADGTEVYPEILESVPLSEVAHVVHKDRA